MLTRHGAPVKAVRIIGNPQPARRAVKPQIDRTIYTLAYRFDAGGESIVISGDLAYSDSLIELAKGADILVMDSGQVIKEEGIEWTPPRQR